MTTDSSRLGPPLSISGAMLWFGRNFLEALIWATAGAAVLVLLLAAYSYPQIAVWTLLAILAAGGLAWVSFGAQRSGHSASSSQTHGTSFRLHVRILGFSIRVARETPGDPQGDRP